MSALENLVAGMDSGESVLPEGVKLGEFQPFAFFDSYMDCIRVMILDRSVTEERFDDFLTLYRTNHASTFDNRYCGFALKGIRHLFDELGIEARAELRLADLIDKIVKARPHTTLARVLGGFPVADLIVEWPEMAEAA